MPPLSSNYVFNWALNTASTELCYGRIEEQQGKKELCQRSHGEGVSLARVSQVGGTTDRPNNGGALCSFIWYLGELLPAVMECLVIQQFTSNVRVIIESIESC